MTHAVVAIASLDANMAMLEAMQRADVDMVELQLPSASLLPMVRYCAGEPARPGSRYELGALFKFMQRVTTAFDLKILMMGYYNSVLQMGHATFCACLAEHGGSGFIIADLPLRRPVISCCTADTHHLSPIVLMTPANSMSRLQEIARHARGFVYCVRGKASPASRRLSMKSGGLMARCRSAPPCLWPWVLASAQC